MLEYKVDVDYKLLLPEDVSNAVNIELLSGDYKGVIYTYGSVTAQENDGEEAYITFEYEVLDSVGLDNLEENEGFKNHIGNILVSIVMNQIPPEVKE